MPFQTMRDADETRHGLACSSIVQTQSGPIAQMRRDARLRSVQCFGVVKPFPGERGTRLELATACLEGVPLFALWHCGGFRRPHATFSFYSLSENCPVMVSPKTR